MLQAHAPVGIGVGGDQQIAVAAVAAAVLVKNDRVGHCCLGDDGIGTEPFLRIAAITGSNRELRAVRGERFLLSRQIETIYAAELLGANEEWKYGITEDEVRQAFSLIVAEWASGDY